MNESSHLTYRTKLQHIAETIEIELSEEAVPASIRSEYLYSIRGGKRGRSLLVLLSCNALNNGEGFVLPAMLAVELLHKASLVHDDIVDHDQMRRGNRTFHDVYGRDIAVVMGDYLFSLAFKKLLELDRYHVASTVMRCIELWNDFLKGLCVGELQDVLYRELPSVNLEDSIETTYLRSGVFIEGIMRIGAVLGGGSSYEEDCLGRYGKSLGLAYQLVNDLNNYSGLEEQVGRTTASDLFNRSKNVIVAHATEHLLENEREQFLRLLSHSESTTDDYQMMVSLIAKAGSVVYITQKVVEQIEYAKEQLVPFADSDARSLLVEIADSVFDHWHWVG